MSDLPSSSSPQLRVVNEFVRGFDERNVDILAKTLHKDFRRIIYPRSLGAPELTKDEWLKNMREVVSFIATPETIRHSVIDAPGKVITHVTTKVKTSSGVELDRESIYITHIVTDEDGNLKVKMSEEFTDSQAYLDLIEAATEAKVKEQNSVA